MTLSAEAIAANYRNVLQRVEGACTGCGRDPSEVTVVAVSKAHPTSAILAAYRAGCVDFGENRVQEWRDKQQELPRRLRWHFIGPLQRNKVKYLVDEVTLIHSIDDAKLVDELEKRADSAHDVLIEVNVGEEEQKAGVSAERATALAVRCAHSAVTRPVGLMCIPPYEPEPEGSRPYYRELAELLPRVRDRLAEVDEWVADEFVHLSMGMTHDFEVAIQEGATLVRVGTAIFGPRPSHATGGGV